MSNRYVPPSMREGNHVAPSAAPSSRWTYTSRDTNGSEQSLRNTSQASRTAPELAPTIIAPSRASSSSVSLVKKPALSSVDEFPSMGSSKPAAMVGTSAWGGSKPSFAEMSRAWAEKKAQEDEEKRVAAERQAAIDREYRAQQEKEKKLMHHSLMSSAHGPSSRRLTNDDAKYDIGGGRDEYHDSDSISSEEYADDGYDEEVVDDTWERSRGKHDYY